MVKNLPADSQRSERSPGEGNGYPLHYSCLGNPMDRGAWRVTVPGVTESDTAERTILSLSSSFTALETRGLLKLEGVSGPSDWTPFSP